MALLPAARTGNSNTDYLFRLIDEHLSTLMGIHGQPNYRKQPYSQAPAVEGEEVPQYEQFTAGFVPTTRTLTAGAGLTGGGTLAADRTFDVGAGTGITVGASTVSVDFSAVVATTVTLTAGAGLTGGGDLSANRTFDVGAGTGIIVNANDVAIDPSVVVTTTSDQAIHQFLLMGA